MSPSKSKRLAPPERPTALFLAAPDNAVEAKEGITLEAASIRDGAWDGMWTVISPDAAGNLAIKVPGCSAAIVKLPLEKPE